MNIFKSFAAALILIFGFGAPAYAEHQALIAASFTDVDDVSGTLAISARNTTVYFHINGVYDMVIDLQREQGSAGSGSWVNVAQDVSPGANDKTRGTYVTSQENENLRLIVSTDTSGTAIVSFFDGRQTPRVLSISTHMNRFDEFHGSDTAQVGDTTWQTELTTFIETDGTVGDHLATIQEGGYDQTAGTGGTITEDVVATSYTVIANDAALISDGVTQVAFRARTSSITGTALAYCLSDTVAIANTIALFVINSNTVADTGSTNDICIKYSSDAADTDSFGMASTNAGTVGNNADEFSASQTLAVDTYVVTTIEIEATGDAFFYIDGSLFAVEPLAVATTARMFPYWYATSATDDTTGGAVQIVDFIDFYLARPSD